jgi:hypothetical protein
MPERDYISFETGSFLRTFNTQSFDMTKFVRPSFVPTSTFPYYFDSLLMAAFANMIDAHKQEDVRYFRVLDWVRYAYLNTDIYSPESRLVMLATTFEIFFDLPDFKKADKFAILLETLLEVDSMEIHDEHGQLIQKGLPEITKPNVHGKDKTNTMYGWWARDFYDLRSKIVHGEDISNQDIRNHKDEQHFFIALKILTFCFYKLLENKSHLTSKKITGIPSFENTSFEKWHAEDELREVEEMIN